MGNKMQIWHFLELIDNEREATRLIIANKELIRIHHLPDELNEYLTKAKAQLSLFRTMAASYEVSGEVQDDQTTPQATT